MKIYLISLGCPKNLVDSEQLLGLIGQEGFIITDSMEDADIVIINTCGFIKDAAKESEENIKEVIKKNKKFIIWGCLVQKEKEKLLRFRNLKGIVGVGDPKQVLKVIKEENEKIVNIRENCFTNIEEFPRLITTFPYAYIKISDGCNNFCSYCLIPKLRGRLRSRKIKDILKEAEQIEKLGFKEIIIIAQDTTNYGKDLNDGSNLINLLGNLEKFDFEWIRIMYMHPGHINEELIEKIGSSKKICKYFDIPMQHISPEILKKMNRPVIDCKKLIEEIRKKIPSAVIRTNFIVGFPGETERDFKQLLEFLEQVKIDRVGFFKYSREKGTVAYNFKDQISEREKEKRLLVLVEKQKDISKKNLKKYIGKTLKVLIEKKDKEFFVGRTEYDAPEIDGLVYVKGKDFKIGDFYNLKIKKADYYDLYA
ncbi:MAG: 30S ribosomal protein S12 methylthiotransferase RimO [Candidatus Omnitrophica bacterium]|nr:30S ribosomal protein S12 methylthiotransferase RimO [Candidatus Omnitrophota bacterium]MCM8802946.1 30S ribosomal protein S12 methylthiotransferase RimO [Candidatus Omnitrophota bacterium]